MSDSFSSYSNEEALLSENSRGDYLVEEVLDGDASYRSASGSGSNYEEEFFAKEEVHGDGASHSHSGSESHSCSGSGSRSQSSYSGSGSRSYYSDEEEGSGNSTSYEGDSFAQDSYAAVQSSKTSGSATALVAATILQSELQQGGGASSSQRRPNDNDPSSDNSCFMTGTSSIITSNLNVRPRNSKQRQSPQHYDKEPVAVLLSTSTSTSPAVVGKAAFMKPEEEAVYCEEAAEKPPSFAPSFHDSSHGDDGEEEVFSEDEEEEFVVEDEQPQDDDSFVEEVEEDIVVEEDSQGSYFDEEDVVLEEDAVLEEGSQRSYSDTYEDEIFEEEEDEDVVVEEDSSFPQSPQRETTIVHPDEENFPSQPSESSDLDTETHSLSHRSESVYGSDAEDARSVRLEEARISKDGLIAQQDDSASSWDDVISGDVDEFFEADKYDNAGVALEEKEQVNDTELTTEGDNLLAVIEEQPAEEEDDIDNIMRKAKEIVVDDLENSGMFMIDDDIAPGHESEKKDGDGVPNPEESSDNVVVTPHAGLRVTAMSAGVSDSSSSSGHDHEFVFDPSVTLPPDDGAVISSWNSNNKVTRVETAEIVSQADLDNCLKEMMEDTVCEQPGFVQESPASALAADGEQAEGDERSETDLGSLHSNNVEERNSLHGSAHDEEFYCDDVTEASENEKDVEASNDLARDESSRSDNHELADDCVDSDSQPMDGESLPEEDPENTLEDNPFDIDSSAADSADSELDNEKNQSDVESAESGSEYEFNDVEDIDVGVESDAADSDSVGPGSAVPEEVEGNIDYNDGLLDDSEDNEEDNSATIATYTVDQESPISISEPEDVENIIAGVKLLLRNSEEKNGKQYSGVKNDAVAIVGAAKINPNVQQQQATPLAADVWDKIVTKNGERTGDIERSGDKASGAATVEEKPDERCDPSGSQSPVHWSNSEKETQQSQSQSSLSRTNSTSQTSFINSFQSEDIILLEDDLSEDDESDSESESYSSQEQRTVVSLLIQGEEDLHPIHEDSAEYSSDYDSSSNKNHNATEPALSAFFNNSPAERVPRQSSFSKKYHVVPRVACASSPGDSYDRSRDIEVDFRNNAILEGDEEEESHSSQNEEQYEGFVNNASVESEEDSSENGAAYPAAGAFVNRMYYDDDSFEDPATGSKNQSKASSGSNAPFHYAERPHNGSQNSFTNSSSSSSGQLRDQNDYLPGEVVWTPKASFTSDTQSPAKTTDSSSHSSIHDDSKQSDFSDEEDDDIETGRRRQLATPEASTECLLNRKAPEQPPTDSRKKKQHVRPRWFLPLVVGFVFILFIVCLVIIPVTHKSKKSTSPGREVDLSTPAPTPLVQLQDDADDVVPTIPPESRLPWLAEAMKLQGPPDTAFGASVVILDDMIVVGDPLRDIVKFFIRHETKGWLELGERFGDQADGRFGTSIGIANERMVVGAPLTHAEGTDIPAGAAFFYVYNQVLSTWQPLGGVLRGDDDILISAGEDFGSSVAVSGAFRIVVGAPKNSLSELEAGRIYTFELSRKAEEGFPLVGDQAGDLFGYSVAICKDGLRFIGGAPGTSFGTDNDGTGYVRVHYWLGTSWEVLDIIRGQAKGEAFGSSVDAVTDDGDIIAVGAPGFQGGAGRIAVYKLDPTIGEYKQVGQNIVGRAGDSLGMLGSLTGGIVADGLIIIGSTMNGEVMRFDYDSENDRWTQLYQNVPNDSAQMSVVAFSSYGGEAKNLLVGTPSAGKVLIYEADLVAPTKAPTPGSVSLPTGPFPTETPVADSPPTDAQATAPPVTEPASTTTSPISGPPTLPPGTWFRSGGPFTGEDGSDFGSSVALAEGFMAVGAPNGLTSPGVVSIFGQKGGAWNTQPMHQLSGTQSGGFFGAAIAMKDQDLLIGAPKVFADGTLTSAGAAYYHVGNADGTWPQLGAVIRGASGLYATNEEFGASVSMSSNRRIAVGAPGNSEELQYQRGKVYVFEYDSELNAWARTQDLPGLTVGEQFGSSVALSSSGNFLIAGSPAGMGAATIYQYNPVTWFSISTIPGEEENEAMGSSVAMLNADGTLVAVGAPGYANGSGRVLVYQREGSSGRFSRFGPPIVGEAGERIGAKNQLSGFGSVVYVGTSTGVVKRFAYQPSTTSWLATEVDSGASTNLWAISSSPMADGFAAGGEDTSSIWTQT